LKKIIFTTLLANLELVIANMNSKFDNTWKIKKFRLL